MQLYNITELQNFVNRTVFNYYNLASPNNIDFYLPRTFANGTIIPVFMNIFQRNNSAQASYELTPNYLGPFSEPDDILQELLQDYSSFTLGFDFYERLDFSVRTDGDCYLF